jgi:hypothetical protein
MINREFILVEFCFENLNTLEEGREILLKLEEEGKLEIIITREASVISTKIDPVFATMLKLKSAMLAERMQISYIPDELKEKYRK